MSIERQKRRKKSKDGYYPSEKKQFFGSCVHLPKSFFDKYDLDEAEEITRERFLLHCDVDPVTIKNMYQYPNDYRFFEFPHEDLFFFMYSAIEHFFR
jgi:hypothetical protein